MLPFVKEILVGLLYRGATLLLLLAFVPGTALGQTQVTGTVVDAETGKPLPGANVFIDGEMAGTATDEQGRFALTNLGTGTYTVVASMVGYEPKQASVTLEADGSSPSIRFELDPQPVKLKGITVEDSREEWLERLAKFRRAFFGLGVPNADQCSFVNPEVLSFEQSGSSLIAHAEKPLRVRNEALGYEVTYHLHRYEISSENRTRLGPFEFDTLEAQSQQQREEWIDARRSTYRGSYFHFIDALKANALGKEDFRVRFVDRMVEGKSGQPRGGRFAKSKDEKLLEAPDIFSPADTAGLGLLYIPESEREHDFIEVRYLGKGENSRFIERYRHERSVRPYQQSWIQFTGRKKVFIDLKTGDFIVDPKLGRITKHGYWGWYKTAATALPGEYHPPNRP